MTLAFEERPSDSPYIETVTQGQTLTDGAPIRPAEVHWHMVIAKYWGKPHMVLAGPLTSSGNVYYEAGAEILWVKFKLGTFMPHLPIGKMVDVETLLPDAATNSFWLKGEAWQYPSYENLDTFAEWLVRDGILVYDPVVGAALQDELTDMPARTVRHHFLRATGLTQTHIRQMRRAEQAVALLESGVSILDTVEEAGYFDQPHLTRSLRQFIGYTPAQIIARSKPQTCHPVQDSSPALEYNTNVLLEVG